MPLIFNNVTDKAIALKKNFIVGVAVEIEEILEEPETDETPSVRKIEQASNGNFQQQWEEMYSTFPVHLKTLLNSSITHLTMDDSLTLALTLIEFQDTFANDDLDIGHFTKIKHKIDTQNVAPTKERMRRTPFGMEDEEEKLIQDLLDKHVIQPIIIGMGISSSLSS